MSRPHTPQLTFSPVKEDPPVTAFSHWVGRGAESGYAAQLEPLKRDDGWYRIATVDNKRHAGSVASNIKTGKYRGLKKGDWDAVWDEVKVPEPDGGERVAYGLWVRFIGF